MACLEEGLHILVEKPIGLTIKATKAIIEAADRAGRIAATAENVRRGVPQRTAKWIFSENKLIGSPRLFHAIHCSYQPPTIPGREPAWHWRVEKVYSGGGIALDSGAHFCDTLRYLFGEVRQVSATVRKLQPLLFKKDDQLIVDEREDTWMAILEFESGLIGFWSYTTAAPAHSFTQVVYYGTEGALVDVGDVFHGPFANALIQRMDGRVRRLSDIARDYRQHLGEEGWHRLFPYDISETFTLECYDFLDAIQKGRQPEVTARDGLMAKAIAIAIYESSTLGHTVRVDDVIRGEVEVYQKPLNERWGL
ncbi:MAG: Gfo/Idh/MocA family oxidoreductase [Armatimonadetes bacterium]|nr:Gfo/Idh/MocA family oxidoreductase [Armatimonadota bacterium]